MAQPLRPQLPAGLETSLLAPAKCNDRMTPAFTPHSMRAIGCSWALYRGVSLANVVASAGGGATQHTYMSDVLADRGDTGVNAGI